MILAYKSWIRRPCVTCREVGRHVVAFGRARCWSCRAIDRVFLALTAPSFPKFASAEASRDAA